MSSKPKVKKTAQFDATLFNAVYPVKGVRVYPNGVLVVVRDNKLQSKAPTCGGGRKDREVLRFTAKSMARMIATANVAGDKLKSMITLTYPVIYPMDGKIVKQDLNHFLTYLRGETEAEYLWFLEFQTRGAPHFHILTDIRVITPRLRVLVAECWVHRIKEQEWFKDGINKLALAPNSCYWEEYSKVVRRMYWFTYRPETIEVLRDVSGAAKYATKYAVKEYQKTPPEGFKGVGRFWGCSKKMSLGKGIYREVTETELREFLDSTNHATSEWDVLPKYLFNVEQEKPQETEQ